MTKEGCVDFACGCLAVSVLALPVASLSAALGWPLLLLGSGSVCVGTLVLALFALVLFPFVRWRRLDEYGNR